MKNKLRGSWISALKKSLSPSKRPPSEVSQQIQPTVLEAATTNTYLPLVHSREKEIYCKCTTDDPLDGQATIEQTRARNRMPSKMELSAIRIQTAFRVYLARRALRSLKALVRLQALVRGYYVRRRTEVTLRCMISLLRIQERTRRQRLMNLRGFIQSDENSKHEEFRSSANSALCKSASIDCIRDADTRESRDLIIEDILASYYGHRELEEAFYVKVSDEFSGSGTRQSSLVHGEVLKGTRELNYGLNDDVAAKAVQLDRINTAAEYMNYQSPFPPLSLKKIAKSRIPIKPHVLIGEYSTCTPRTPNYMAFTESARAKLRHQRSIATKMVSPPSTSVCTTSNSPGQVSLHVKSSLSVRTGRSSASLTESYGRGVTTSSVGEMRKWMRKRWEERQSLQHIADVD